jgi:hypothetical protein
LSAAAEADGQLTRSAQPRRIVVVRSKTRTCLQLGQSGPLHVPPQPNHEILELVILQRGQTDDPAVVAATMAKPGAVLRRPVGSDGPFKEHAELPTDLAEVGEGRARRRSKPKNQADPKISDKQARKALEFEKEQKRRDRAPEGGGRQSEGARAAREGGRFISRLWLSEEEQLAHSR